LIGWLREVMQGLVIANKPMLLREHAITVLHLPAGREEVVREFAPVVDLEAARNDVRQRVASLATIAPSERAALAELLTSFLDANLSEDAAATAQRRDQAERAVLPVQVRVPKGTVLVARGQRVTPELVTRLALVEAQSSPRSSLSRFAGLILLTSLLAFFLYRYTTYHQRAFIKERLMRRQWSAAWLAQRGRLEAPRLPRSATSRSCLFSSWEHDRIFRRSVGGVASGCRGGSRGWSAGALRNRRVGWGGPAET
jgi:hypothetical protein